VLRTVISGVVCVSCVGWLRAVVTWGGYSCGTRGRGALEHTLRGHSDSVETVAVCDTEGLIVSGARDTTLRIWDVRTGRCLHMLQGHMGAVSCLEVDDQRIVSAGEDGLVLLWDFGETEVKAAAVLAVRAPAGDVVVRVPYYVM